MEIKLSIITPVFNREDCISRCLKSVASQIYTNYEHIVIDDGSIDATYDIINQLMTNNDKIKLISYKENKGVNFARNKGIDCATGDFIFFLDSDDYLLDYSLDKIIECIEKNPNIEHFLFLNKDGRDNRIYPQNETIVHFSDWLIGKYSGDFAHVVKSSILKQFKFNEMFRIFEDLNWLRIYRYIEQLITPIYVAVIDTNRSDSVSREAYLDNMQSMKNYYNYIIQLVDLYESDYRRLELELKLRSILIKGIFIGVAIGENIKNKDLIEKLDFNKCKKECFYIINNKCFRKLIFTVIQTKSRNNQWILLNRKL